MSSRRGFTILELLLTLLVLSLVAAFTIPRFFSHPVVTLENAAKLLAQDLRAAQNRSAYMAEACDFHFPEDRTGYVVRNIDGEILINPATSLDFFRNYPQDAVFEGVVVVEVDCGGDRTIRYDNRGRATESARITLSFEGDTRIVEVEAGKGRVDIIGSTSGWIDRGY